MWEEVAGREVGGGGREEEMKSARSTWYIHACIQRGPLSYY